MNKSELKSIGISVLISIIIQFIVILLLKPNSSNLCINDTCVTEDQLKMVAGTIPIMIHRKGNNHQVLATGGNGNGAHGSAVSMNYDELCQNPKKTGDFKYDYGYNKEEGRFAAGAYSMYMSPAIIPNDLPECSLVEPR
jgi:hypothetical protein